MSNAIGSSRESSPSRRICHLRAVPLGHVADAEMIVNVEKQMTNKIDASVMAEFEKRIAILKNKEDRQAEAVMKESYEKRLNILIHGLEED